MTSMAARPWRTPELYLLEEWDDLLLPEYPLVLLAQVGEGVAGLAVVDVRQPRLHTQPQVVADDLALLFCHF
jgi:hypothetical protein